MQKSERGLPEPMRPTLISTLVDGAYRRTDFKIDAVAGLTVAIVALPLSMAIAIASGLQPEQGLFAAVVGGFLISLLGGSRYQIGGPAGAFIVLVASIVERHGHSGLLLATAMAGTMMVLLGLFRLGGLVRLVPPSVTIGFTAAIGVIIFISQIRDLLGIRLAQEPSALGAKIAALFSARDTITPAAIMLSIMIIALILLLRRYRPSWPALLIAIVTASLAAKGLGLDIATVGSRFGGVPHALPPPSLPDVTLARLLTLLPDAIAIALLGSIESLLSAVVADKLSGDRHRSNIELVAQGIANIAAGLFAAMPVTGTIARTATNVRAGAASPLAGVLHAVYLLAFMMIAADLAAYVPLAALAAILAITSWSMIERHEIAHLFRHDRRNALVATVTALVTLAIDLVAGIAAGVIVSIIIKAFEGRTGRATGKK